MPTFFFLRCCSCLLCRLMLITCFIELRHGEIIQTQGERKVLEKKKEFLDWADFMAAVLRCYFAHTPLSTHLDLISIFSLFCLLYKKMIVLRWIEKINSHSSTFPDFRRFWACFRFSRGNQINWEKFFRTTFPGVRQWTPQILWLPIWLTLFLFSLLSG